MVPEGWTLTPIKNICESIIDCVNKTAKTVDHVTPYKMIRTTNVRNGRVDTENVRYVDEETYRQWVRRGAPKAGDIIFTREAPVGEVGLLEDSSGVFLGQRTIMYRAHPDRTTSKFLLYSLLGRYCQIQIENFSNGGTVAHVRVPDCGEILVRIPPLPEQTKIAKILSTWDKAIETTEKLIENSKAQKKALMQQFLTGKKRFPGFDGKWKEVTIKEMGRIVSGGTPDTQVPDYWDGDILWATPTDITALRTHHINNTKRKITLKGVKESSASLLPVGTLLVCTRATIGEIAIAENEITTNQGFKSLVLGKEYDGDFVYYLFKYLKHKFVRFACGSTFLELSKKDFEKRKFIVPEKKEQLKIAEVLNNVTNETYELGRTLEHFRNEKKSLMQQLLTGKRRVKLDNDLEPSRSKK